MFISSSTVSFTFSFLGLSEVIFCYNKLQYFISISRISLHQLYLQQLLATGLTIDHLSLITNSLGPFAFFFIICESGNYLTQEFNQIADAYYKTSWYMLPVDMQKIWPVAIGFGQMEIGIGSTHCKRDLYAQVCK